MESIKGKKLLLLGATSDEIFVVKRAKELGAYTIVTDYNLNHKFSPAKDVADEYWDLSWSDLDLLEQKCKECGVDGVLAGYSEIRIDNMIQLCQRLNLPSYATQEQLAVTRDKVLLKNECRKYNIPVVKDYISKENVTEFPVIVKPTDRAGSIGISIAWNKQEFDKAVEYASEESLTGQIIIEEYIQDGKEIDINFGIINGEVFLLSTADTIEAKNNKKNKKVIQSGRLLPEKHENSFIEKHYFKFVNMIKSWGIKNGTLFFSAFVNEKAEFLIFECGFRLWGVQEFEYTARKGLINYLDIYIVHALTGRSPEISNIVNSKLKGVEINFYSKAGTVAKIEGLKEIADMSDCFIAAQDVYIGQICENDKAILSKLALVGFANESSEKLQEDVEKAYSLFVAVDENGNDMVYDRIDTTQIAKWWN